MKIRPWASVLIQVAAGPLGALALTRCLSEICEGGDRKRPCGGAEEEADQEITLNSNTTKHQTGRDGNFFVSCCILRT